ncbi:MAG: valine--tRNA ligase [Patescibacteria group bacterium]
MEQPNTPEKLLKPYDPKTAEDIIYKRWEESGFFNPDVCVEKGITAPDAPHFSVTLPPPNVTGVLHIGHAYEYSLQDAVVRYARMRGKKTLWVPGTDSAAIATQARVEKDILKEEKKTRHDLGREELVLRVQEFAQKHEGIIVGQIKKVGASLDWSRYAYTLDEKRYRAVMTAFKNMYDAGLIYRGHRIVNWDPKGQTTISDDEVIYEARKGKLYTFRYSKDFPISISTTRPETKVGDTAVAVHPSDTRYAQFVGKEYDAVFCGVSIHIKIVADETVDPEFGTGALGVTPAHSMIDAEIAERHTLPMRQVINEFARMTVTGPLENKKVGEAREIVVAWLTENGLLEKEEDVEQNISLSERTGAVVEPLPMLQWFVAVDRPFVVKHSKIPGIEIGSSITLKTLMRIAVKSGAVEIPQERFQKSYFHWIENLHDWCISRQIWFGHRIPVWYRGEEAYVGVEAPDGDGWVQDPDVLDTWFSSALWTFSTLGWPKETKDLQAFHPTSFMSPAYEILNLWISRMILMSGFHLGEAPFKIVLIHGLVRDKQGRKFSKSLGTGVDPLDIIEKYGADALRMGLLVGTAIGNDVSFDENKVKGYKHFANKLWNIARFVLTYADTADMKMPITADADKTYLDEWEEILKDVTIDIETYRLHLAAEKLYHYVWHRFADVIIEESKPILNGEDAPARSARAHALLTILAENLKALHPFMPFVTEEIWSVMPAHMKTQKFLMVEKWPTE